MRPWIALVVLLLLFTPASLERDHDLVGSRSENPSIPLDAPFSVDVMVSDDPISESQVEPDAVVDDLGYVHVGWIDRRTGVWRVRYARSTDGGLSFGPSMEMADATHPETGDPVLAFANGALYYAWISFDRTIGDSDVAMRVSYDRGVTWGPLIKVSDSPSSLFSDKPWIAARGDTLYAVYADIGATYEVRFRKSTDQGLTWQPSVRVNADTVGWGNGACIDIGPNDEIYVSWWDSTPAGEGIFFSKSTDGGLTFSPNKQIAVTDWWGNDPVRAAAVTSLAVGPKGNIYIVYANLTTPDWNIEFIRSLDNGTTFSLPVVVNDDMTTEVQFMPWVDVDPLGTVHIAYYDNRTQQLEIRYTNSTDGGASFIPSIRMSDMTFVPEWFIGDYIPLVADIWTNIHVVWCDRRNGNNDIYYSRLEGPGVPGPPPAAVSSVSARLQGPSHGDINITWTLSADDGGGQNSVTNYSILYSFAYNGTGLGYMWLDTVSAGTSHYVANGMGHGDPLDYFFIIRAYDVWGEWNDSLQQAGKFTRMLEPGWNLISPPLILEDPSLGTVLQTISHQCVREFDEGNAVDKWKQLCPFKRYGEVETLGLGSVLWVNIKKTGNWTVAGSVPQQWTVWLGSGWNLIGAPAFSGYDIARMMMETKADRVEGFSGVDSPYRLRTMFDFEPLQAGYGYWVHVTAGQLWTVENL